MFTTVHEDNLRAAYDILHILADQEGDKVEEYRVQIKRAIRAYNKRPIDEALVIEQSSDGLLTVFPLPADLKTEYAAKDYFVDHHLLAAPNSMYDCTGKVFTVWFKIFRRRGQFWAYHATAMDV